MKKKLLMCLSILMLAGCGDSSASIEYEMKTEDFEPMETSLIENSKTKYEFQYEMNYSYGKTTYSGTSYVTYIGTTREKTLNSTANYSINKEEAILYYMEGGRSRSDAEEIVDYLLNKYETNYTVIKYGDETGEWEFTHTIEKIISEEKLSNNKFRVYTYDKYATNKKTYKDYSSSEVSQNIAALSGKKFWNQSIYDKEGKYYWVEGYEVAYYYADFFDYNTTLDEMVPEGLVKYYYENKVIKKIVTEISNERESWSKSTITLEQLGGNEITIVRSTYQPE